MNVCLLSEHKPLKKCEHCLQVHPHRWHGKDDKMVRKEAKKPWNVITNANTVLKDPPKQQNIWSVNAILQEIMSNFVPVFFC